MTRLTVFYDPACGLCTASAAWLDRQPQVVPLDLVPGGQNEAISRLATGDLVVVADSGEVWRGTKAWIMTLWALADYRDLAETMAGSVFGPLARQVFENISKNRASLSGLLGLQPEACPLKGTR